MPTPPSKAVGALITTLNDENSDVRCIAAWAIGRHADRNAVEPLIVALNDQITEVRCAAARALGQLADNRALPALQQLVEYDQSETIEGVKVSQVAAEVMERIKSHKQNTT